MRLAAIDTETTGFDPVTGAELIEVAVSVAVYKRDQPYIEATSSILVEPKNDIPPEAAAVHHITKDTLAAAETVYSREAVGEWLGIFAADCDAIVAHNSLFDKSFLPELADAPWICTMTVAKHLWPDAPKYGLQVIRYWLGLPDDHVHGYPHRAAYDAAVCAHLVLAEMTYVGGPTWGPKTKLAELIKLTNTQPILKKVPFGKHYGELWADVPQGYMQWILKKNSATPFDPAVVHTCKHHLGLLS